MKPLLKPQQIVSRGQAVLSTEAAAITALIPRLGDTFVRACQLIMECKGRLVVSGMGKSGHIGNKLAATFASTGTPAFFVHAAEASHGDIGMITPQDVVLVLSNSGETDELLTILPVIKRLGIALIVLTGRTDSTLGRAATITLDVSVSIEACPLNLAPTASTTATVAVLEARGFTEEDFARAHPGGSLGRRLLLYVEDVMHTGVQLPLVTPTTLLREGLLEMTRKGLGVTAVVDDQQRLLGVFTDGDLRRALDKQIDLHTTLMGEVMTANPKRATPRMLAAAAVHLMETHQITALPVVDDHNILIGALNVHDLLRAGVL
jgi:arabinose-5-phosphate isomerase